jgi:peptide/nickel transport system permease protein
MGILDHLKRRAGPAVRLPVAVGSAKSGAVRRPGAVAVVAAAIVALVVLAAILAPIISPYDPDAQSLELSLSGPSSDRPLGSDKLGRDLLSRLVFGSRSSLLSALLVVILSTSIGILLGVPSAYYGGFFDAAVSRVLDFLLAFPALLLALVAVAAFGRGLPNAIIALSVVYVPAVARIVRSACLVEKGLPYAEAARALGYSDRRIMFRHLLPNVLPLVLVQVAVDFAYALLDLAALSFLGLGAQPPQADWGSMLAEGRDLLLIAPRLALVPGLAIMASVVAFNILADALKERSGRAEQGRP